MPGFWKRLWCALRDHPFKRKPDFPFEDYDSGDEPFPPSIRCSNCGAVMNGRRRGMHS